MHIYLQGGRFDGMRPEVEDDCIKFVQDDLVYVPNALFVEYLPVFAFDEKLTLEWKRRKAKGITPGTCIQTRMQE